MYAHPQYPISADLESALKSYCSGEENFPEVLVVTQNDATTLSQTPRIVLDQPLDHITLYVKLNKNYNYEEVSTTTYDLDDRELIIFVGTSPQHPLHYFISHEDALGSRHPNLYGMFIKEGLMKDIYSSYMRDFDLPTEETLGEEITLTKAQSDCAMFTSYQFMGIELGELPYTASRISSDSADEARWEGTMAVRYRDGQVWVSHENNPYGDDRYMRYDLDSIASHEALLMRAMDEYSKTWFSSASAPHEVYALTSTHDRSRYTDRPIVELHPKPETVYVQLGEGGSEATYASCKYTDLRDDSLGLTMFYWIADGYIILTHDDTPSNKDQNLFNRYSIEELMS